MIYAYDEPVQFPVVDLYDSGMMGAFLTAAKDLYDTALKEQADFMEKYGDFYSPIANDVNAWYGYINPVYDEIDRIYAEGGDPLRNPVDRARIRLMRGRVPRLELAKLKESAKAAEEYLKNRAKLEAAGKWNPAFESMIMNNMGLPDFEHWDTAKNGIWNRLSPAEFLDLNLYTSHIFDDLKPSTIGKTKDGRWIIKGVSEQAMRDSMTPHLGGIVGSDLGQWYYRLAKNELISEGNDNPTNAEIMQRLQDNIIIANKERLYQLEEADPYAVEQQKFGHNMAIARMREAGANQRAAMRIAAIGSQGNGNGSGNGNGNPQLNDLELTHKNGMSAIINGTRVANNFGGAVNYSTFNPITWGSAIGAALFERASTFYGNTNLPAFSGSLDTTFRGNGPLSGYGIDPNTGSFVKRESKGPLGGWFSFLPTSRALGGSQGSNKPWYQTAKETSLQNLHSTNMSFLRAQSTPYTSGHFAAFTGRDANNGNYIMVNTTEDAPRLFTQDEIALGAHGVKSLVGTKAFTQAVKESNNLRSQLRNYDSNDIYMKSTGLSVTVVGSDNIVRTYQYVNVYRKVPKTKTSTRYGESGSFSGSTKSESSQYAYMKLNNDPVLYDMQITTYPSNSSDKLNLYFDDKYITNNIYSGYRATKDQGVSSNNMKADNVYLDAALYGDEVLDEEELMSDGDLYE